MSKNMHRHSSQEDKQMASKHVKRCSISLAIREIQIKTMMKYHYLPIKVAKKKKKICGSSLVDQWTWRFHHYGLGSIPGLGTEIPHQGTARHGQKNKRIF